MFTSPVTWLGVRHIRSTTNSSLNIYISNYVCFFFWKYFIGIWLIYQNCCWTQFLDTFRFRLSRRIVHFIRITIWPFIFQLVGIFNSLLLKVFSIHSYWMNESCVYLIAHAWELYSMFLSRWITLKFLYFWIFRFIAM